MTRLLLLGLAVAAVGFVSPPRADAGPLTPPAHIAAADRAGLPVAPVKKSRRVKTHKTSPKETDTPAGKASDSEVLFGVQDVGFLVDRDVIRVGAEIGKFDRVRLRVLKNDIHITDLKVLYENGDLETLISDAKLRKNRKTDWIDLNRSDFIKEFQVVYRSRPDFKGQARLEVFGEFADGWLGPDGEGQRYNNGWVLLGTDTAGSIGFDKVKIPVGDNEGGFKKLRVSVKDRDITMTNLAVVYEGGDKDQLEKDRVRIAADEAFGPLELEQDASIKEILATWRSRAFATSKRDRAYATVEVWAHH